MDGKRDKSERRPSIVQRWGYTSTALLLIALGGVAFLMAHIILQVFWPKSGKLLVDFGAAMTVGVVWISGALFAVWLARQLRIP